MDDELLAAVNRIMFGATMDAYTDALPHLLNMLEMDGNSDGAGLVRQLIGNLRLNYG